MCFLPFKREIDQTQINNTYIFFSTFIFQYNHAFNLYNKLVLKFNDFSSLMVPSDLSTMIHYSLDGWNDIHWDILYGMVYLGAQWAILLFDLFKAFDLI